MSFHSAEQGLSLHQLHAFTFTSAANLSAGSPSSWNGSAWVAMSYTFTSADEGKIALLLGDGGATQFGTTANSFFSLLLVTAGVPTWSLITSAGSESSGINYITNGLAAQGNTTGWSVYQDAAGASPVSGSGTVVDGTPITFVASSSSPLRGAYSFLLSRPAANKQGEGVAFAFTIDPADKASVLSVSFDYTIASGTFASGTQAPGTITPSDITVWIYDVTNGIVGQVSPYVLTGNGSNSFHFKGVFQSSSSSVSYRLLFHCGTTNTTAFDLKIDNVQVGPQIQLEGPAVSDWVSYTPTISSGTGTITNSTAAGQWRRVGDSMEIQVILTFNSTSVGTWTQPILSLPSGYAIDTTKMASGYTGTFGQALFENFGNNAYINAGIEPYSSTSIQFFYSTNASGSATSITQAAPFTISSGSYFTGNLIVPILGWSSNVLMSSDTDTRIVAAQANVITGSQTLSGSYQNITNINIFSDTHGAWNASTGVYTVPVTGYYFVSALYSYANSSSGNYGELQIVTSNGSLSSPATLLTAQAAVTPISGTFYLTVGQTITIQAYQNTGGSFAYDTNNSGSRFSIQRLSGPSVIAATDTVSASYYNTAETTLTNGGSTTIPWPTKDFDTHGQMNTSTGVYTVPVAGKYRVSATIQIATTLTAARMGLFIYHGATAMAFVASIQTTGTNTSVSVTKTIQCLAGDTLSIQGNNANGSGTTTITTNTNDNFVSIDRIGN
jgi:hypothetical protein